MARQLNKLTPRDVKTKGPGLHNDGEGLYLRVKPEGSRSWVFRYRVPGRNSLRDKGLGSCNVLSLPEARATARTYRVELLKGIDPIDSRRAARNATIAAAARQVSFKACADAYIASQQVVWRNAKHIKQWTDSLDDYCGEWANLPVGSIDTSMVYKALIGRWETHTETATRVRQRIERVLDWAKVRGLRHGENPARWRGHLDKLLPSPSEFKEVTHRAALPYQEVPDFMRQLGALNTGAAKALTLQVLTAVRPGEAAGARWEEFDLNSKVWTIPKLRMKSKKSHLVPLSPAALELVKSLARGDSEFLFPGAKDKSLTTAAMMKLLKRLRPGQTCHGFRSSFRDWAADMTSFAGAVAEFALAHGVKDQTVAAYLRTTYFEKRKELMEVWATYCYSEASQSGASPARLERA